MAEDGYIPVDSRTLASRFPDVYAVGDVATVGVPKAGVFSEGAARAVAALDHRPPARAAGRPAPYDGDGSATSSSATISSAASGGLPVGPEADRHA